MATILTFRRSEERKPKSMPAGHEAEVVFFTGVRYERTPSTGPTRIGVSAAKGARAAPGATLSPV